MRDATWTEVKAFLPSEPADWSAWHEVFERHDIHGTVQTEKPLALSGYVSPGQEDVVASLKAALLAFGATEVTETEVEETDWEEAWKQFFKPRRVGKRFVVAPIWEDYEKEEGDLMIWLDPGQAFGTGDHPTTRGCLELLEKVGCEGKDVADIGCGSGILAVGAGLLGARSLVLVDVEPPSVESARDNLVRNGVTGAVFLGMGFDPLPDGAQYDLVLSNIISAALIGIAGEASLRVREGGHWVISGIIHDNWGDVLHRAEQCGFELVEKFEEGDWVAATLRR